MLRCTRMVVALAAGAWLAACHGGNKEVGAPCRLDCDDYCHGPGDCLADLYCTVTERGIDTARTCQARCNSLADCAADEYCHYPGIDEYPDTCWKRAKLGESCTHYYRADPSDICLSGLICVPDSTCESGVSCSPTKTCRQACGTEAPCPVGSTCEPVSDTAGKYYCRTL